MKINHRGKTGLCILLIGFCAQSILADEKNIGAGSKIPNTKVQFSYFIQSIAYVGIDDKFDEYDDHFSVKRARLDTRIFLGRAVSGRIQGDLTRSPALVDAYVEFIISDNLSFKMGKFKSPLSLERAQSVPALLFNDFAYTASIAPNRDIGVCVNGTFFKRYINVQIAYMNGAPNNQSFSGDIDDSKDWVARVSISPFSAKGEIENISLLFSVGALTGYRKGEALHNLKTPAGTEVFLYSSFAKSLGPVFRFSPQFKVVTPNIFLLGEYLYSDYGITDSSEQQFRVSDRAWALSMGYVVFGGKRSEKGIALKKTTDISKDPGGALELVARLHGYHPDPAIFERFASPLTCVSRVLGFEIGCHWYYADNSCIRLVYSRSLFKSGSPFGDRKPENTLQLSINLTGKL